MHPKIVFLDLDGTLLNDNKSVSTRDRLALWELHDCGIKIGFLTSRTERKIYSFIKDLPCDFIGCINGSVIKFYNNNSLIWEQTSGIAWNHGIQLIKACEKVSKKHLSAFFYPYQMWDGQIFKDEKNIGSLSEVINSITPVRFQRIRLYSSKDFPELDLTPFRVAQIEDDILFESKQIEKGNAVQRILEYYNISSDSAICFGDEINDINMFRYCSVSVAPCNASLEVQQCATDITCDNNHDCVADWFEKKRLITSRPHLKGSIKPNDCIYLLKDISNTVKPIPFNKKKELLQKGLSSAFIFADDPPITEEENSLFLELLEQNCVNIATYVGVLAESILSEKRKFPVLVSLVRGGVVYGTLCRRYYQKVYHEDTPHYAISLVRGIGIDVKALDYIVQHHGDSSIQFIDGWTGSGLLRNELNKYIEIYNKNNKTNISSDLAVLADTSGVCLLSGTREDIMLPDCCLNATVCGLISSVCVSPELIDEEDFHGAALCASLSNIDYSNYYIDTISYHLTKQRPKKENKFEFAAKRITSQLIEEFGLINSKKVRLGIGECTRAMFRCTIKYLLVIKSEDSRLQYLCKMAETRHIPIQTYCLGKYSCAVILE